MTTEQIAQVCHEANRVYCDTHGDFSQSEWADAPQWQKASAIMGVEALIADERLQPIDLHQRWMDHKAAEGWVYGPAKDAAAKTHPCMVRYYQLPVEQRRKDHLFHAIVRAITRGIA